MFQCNKNYHFLQFLNKPILQKKHTNFFCYNLNKDDKKTCIKPLIVIKRTKKEDTMTANTKKIITRLTNNEKTQAITLAKQIWKLAEPGFCEHNSAKLTADYLSRAGFHVEFCFPNIPTAFIAVFGLGKPIIGILGEYDALPACTPEKFTKNTYGHGCGHHLVGAGGALAAVVLARMLKQSNRHGTIVFLGCPAEELLAGKVYMARDGAFDGLDVCLEWHPGVKTYVDVYGGSALDSLVFEFYGVTAHAAFAHAGRSALDGAMLTDVAVNYLREHVPERVRIHGVLTRGGYAPNVVPDYARLWYYVRAPDRKTVDTITQRVIRCARAGAMATDTKLKVRYLTGVYERLPNMTLANLLFNNLRMFGQLVPSANEKKEIKQKGLKPEFNREISMSEEVSRASNDADNVSWITPLGYFCFSCMPKATKGHHTTCTIQSNTAFAYRGMVRSAEVLIATAWELIINPRLLQKVRKEFMKKTKKIQYNPLVPATQKPSLLQRLCGIADFMAV